MSSVGYGINSLKRRVSQTLSKAFSEIINGSSGAYIDFGGVDNPPQTLVGTGASIFLDQNSANSITPQTRNIVTSSPEGVILIKKKVFSTLASSNDVAFLDKTEKMLIRATKALFAYKVQQIRAYESLTKFETYYSNNQVYSLNLLSSFIKEASALGLKNFLYTKEDYIDKRLNDWYQSSYQFDGEVTTVSRYLSTLPSSESRSLILKKTKELEQEYEIGSVNSSMDFERKFFQDMAEILASSGKNEQYNKLNEDIVRILKRNAFSQDNFLTTWVVDPDSPDNYTLGPGTGVIELTTFSSFSTNCSTSSSVNSASFDVSYPYKLGTILEDDIEVAINEALYGTVGILSELIGGGLRSEGVSGRIPPIDGASIVASALEIGGAGFLDKTINIDYIRDRLRTFYLGKPMINPPDAIHFFARGSRTNTDYTSVGLSYPVEAQETPFDRELLEIDDTILKAEYKLYTTQSISYEQYKDLRKRNDNSFGMIHLFGGYVINTSERYSNGFYSLSVNCESNMGWLRWSRFSIKPALSDPATILEDPLTPYEVKKDELGQAIPFERDLIYENKQLLQSGLLSYDSGILAGRNATEGNIIQGQFNGIGSLNGKKIIQHPDGFVYRWKTGVFSATAGFQLTDPTGENNQANRQYSTYYATTVATDALNNLDIPNILSLLIVGQPYNIETFIEQSFAAHNKLNKSNKLSPEEPLAGIVESIRKQNEYYGNFQPYRTMTVSSMSYEQMVRQSGARLLANENVKKLQNKKIEILKKIKSIQDYGTNSTGLPYNAIKKTLEAEIASIDDGIRDQIDAANQSRRYLNSRDEIGISVSINKASIGLPVSDDKEESQDITRAMMMVGSQRRIEDVRLNRDRNLFIVSDQYDTADIRPFILSLNSSGFPLFDGNFTNAYEKCTNAANILKLEFFCNTQGHLEFRPPLWNRVPLTVLKESIIRQRETGKNIIPEFITKLFSTRVDNLYLEIHSLNIKIVLISLLLGKFPDSSLIPGMKVNGINAIKFFGIVPSDPDKPGNPNVVKGLANYFGVNAPNATGLQLRQADFRKSVGTITKRNNSIFGNGIRLGVSYQSKGDILNGDTETLLGIFDPITQEQQGVINNLLTSINSDGKTDMDTKGVSIDLIATPNNLNSIRDAFKQQFGLDPAQGIINGDRFENKDFLKNNNDIDKAFFGESSLIKALGTAISQRDKNITMLQANLAKQRELQEIESILSGSYNDPLDVADGLLSGEFTDYLQKSATSIRNATDILTGRMSEGTVFDHLIEDDTRNLLGYGSGKRFIIKDEYIIDATYNERPPDFTRVDVKGDAPLGLGSSLNRGVDGRYFWAAAVDFDLVRQYGYKPSSPIGVPFFNDSEGQCRPYAVLELLLQRAAISTASITVPGNEFYQPGDTVYIPSSGLLYYVSAVIHSFSYSSRSFTTRLELTYGHPPGYYLPTPLDVVGQETSFNILEDPAIVYRTSLSDDKYRPLKPDSSLIFPSTSTDVVDLLSYLDNQVRFTNMMIDVNTSIIANKYLLIRGFVTNAENTEAIQEVNNKISIVKSLFLNPKQIAQNHPYSGGDDLVESISQSIGRISSVFGGPANSSTRSLTQLILPNNSPVFPVANDKIIEQVVYLNKGDDKQNPLGQIRCMDRKLQEIFITSLDQERAIGYFPKGGPRQASWIHIRDEIVGLGGANLSGNINVIEVGIIDIPESAISGR
jgi:hypothetical protein